MRDTDLFQLALGLSSPWRVTRSAFEAESGRLDLYVDFPRGSRFACAECGGEGCAVHDTKDDTWRHLPHAFARSRSESEVSGLRRSQGRDAMGSGGFGV